CTVEQWIGPDERQREHPGEAEADDDTAAGERQEACSEHHREEPSAEPAPGAVMVHWARGYTKRWPLPRAEGQMKRGCVPLAGSARGRVRHDVATFRAVVARTCTRRGSGPRLVSRRPPCTPARVVNFLAPGSASPW